MLYSAILSTLYLTQRASLGADTVSTVVTQTQSFCLKKNQHSLSVTLIGGELAAVCYNERILAPRVRGKNRNLRKGT